MENNNNFVHLHVHSYYSSLHGLSTIKQLVDKAVACNMQGMALTDKNMFGVKEFIDYCNEVNENKIDDEKFKPIIGCEMYCAHGDLHSRGNFLREGKGWHLILLAKNEVGYHNLLKIVNEAWTDGFYHCPRTDHKSLEKYHEGLIATSACIAGEIPRYIQKGQLEEAEKSVEWFKNLFGDDFYIELMRHEVKDQETQANRDIFRTQKSIEPTLIELAHKHDVKIICTNDVYFANEEDAETHDNMLCIATGKEKNDPSRWYVSKQEWLKTSEEMAELFSDIPEALDNTIEILNKVEWYNIDQFQEIPSELDVNVPYVFKQ